jgi:hypothetical protein
LGAGSNRSAGVPQTCQKHCSACSRSKVALRPRRCELLLVPLLRLLEPDLTLLMLLITRPLQVVIRRTLAFLFLRRFLRLLAASNLRCFNLFGNPRFQRGQRRHGTFRHHESVIVSTLSAILDCRREESVGTYTIIPLSIETSTTVVFSALSSML